MASSSSSAQQTRRDQNCSEESNSATGSSTGSFIASDPCRMGFPAPLPPFPTRHHPLDKDHADLPILQALREAAFSSVKKRDIKWEDLTIVQRRASGKTLNQSPTLLISTSEQDDNGWYLVLKDIQDFLLANESPLVSVEIIHPTPLKSPAHFPVETGHPIVSVWSHVRKDVASILDEKPWSSISAVRRGFDNEPTNNPVTIVITSPAPEQLSHLRSMVHYRCRDFGLTSIEIAFVRVENDIFAAGGFLNPEEGKPFPLTDDLYPGASLGPKDHGTATGTLGGQLVIRRGNEETCVGLTNFHVVQNDNFPEAVQTHGFGPSDTSSSQYKVVSPSNFDAQYYSEELGRGASDAEERAMRYKIKYSEDMDDMRQDTLRNLESMAQTLSGERKKLDDLQRHVGTVWAGSGHRITNDFYMDWGLVSLHSRPLKNELPNREELKTLRGPAALTFSFPSSGQIEKFGELEEGTVCLKKGRTTGLTEGVCNTLQPVVKIGGRAARVWHVVGQYNSTFCEKGDSGAWVTDELGQFVGLLFSSSMASYSGDGYVLPIQEVVADIEEITGGKVSLPAAKEQTHRPSRLGGSSAGKGLAPNNQNSPTID